ncbi:hypothetical protein U5801_02380 [Lamprobacter modestohalophilus]|uniref:hypothetical protein n=1 Tax=Lamprobacter modestohalophilus TaxID=1064514 RepID=UPI002ADECBBE|nr:hypothetical protein [Lamprobacter modestohalophilus]MEA1048671.1 hypothetical protein [Lamprobacter modestohalophilus]
MACGDPGDVFGDVCGDVRETMMTTTKRSVPASLAEFGEAPLLALAPLSNAELEALELIDNLP